MFENIRPFLLYPQFPSFFTSSDNCYTYISPDIGEIGMRDDIVVLFLKMFFKLI